MINEVIMRAGHVIAECGAGTLLVVGLSVLVLGYRCI